MYDLLEFNIRVTTIAHLNPALEFYFAKNLLLLLFYLIFIIVDFFFFKIFLNAEGSFGEFFSSRVFCGLPPLSLYCNPS